MSESFIQISEQGRKAHLVKGLSMRRCVVFSEGNLIAGQAWIDEIIESGKAEPLLIIKDPEVDAFRKDATEEWGDPKFPKH